jgi:glycosyltransferase involved in cell wall biosynthesis
MTHGEDSVPASRAPAVAGTVAVLVCTYRGEAYLPRQLDTIVEQTHTDWVICASDDGSDDGTLAILQRYQQRLGAHRLRIFKGPCRGFARNFLSLIGRGEIQADYFAFTDQDDEWDACKLERAVAALRALAPAKPGLYGSRSELIDHEGRHLGFSRVFTRRPGFANAMVQNMATGNTMVMNRAAMALLRAAGTDIRVSAHDWWTYLLVTGSGGEMIYDRYPTIRYRQHGANLYGANRSLAAKWTRLARLFRGDFRQWNTENIAALRRNWTLLTEPSRRQVELFERARLGSSPSRLSCLFYLLRSRVYRQTWDGQLALFIAALARRL